MDTIVYSFIIITVVITIICTGISEQSAKKNKDENWGKDVLSIVKIGISKTLSTIGITLLIAICSVLLLSILIKPKSEVIMPAYHYVGTYFHYNDEDEGVGEDESADKDRITIDEILEESKARIEIDMESAYNDMAYAYFCSGNYDLAIEKLKECHETNPSWEYAYNIGVSYGYLTNYRMSIEYMNEALELDPPIPDRGVIVNTKIMLEGYYNTWFSSLFR